MNERNDNAIKVAAKMAMAYGRGVLLIGRDHNDNPGSQSPVSCRAIDPDDYYKTFEPERHMAELVEELLNNGYQGGCSDEGHVQAWAALAVEIANGLEYADLTAMQQHEAWAKHLPTE